MHQAVLYTCMMMSTCSGSFLYDAHQAGAASHRVKTAWQPHPLVEPATECQAFKIAWPLHFFQVLVEITTESQALQTTWQCHSVQTWLNLSPKLRLCKLPGKVTPSRLWSTQSPNFKLCRLLGKVTTCRLSLSSGWKVKPCRYRQPSNPNSRSADCLVKPFGLNHGQGNQTSGFANCLARSLFPHRWSDPAKSQAFEIARPRHSCQAMAKSFFPCCG